MTKYIISSILLLSVITAQAHNPDVSSTILSENEDKTWFLQLRSALTAYEYIITKNYGEASFSTPEEFQALVLQHVKDNISITYNENTEVSLESGMVKLGHETNVIFKVMGTPKDIKSMIVTNNTFKDIHRNQSALVILKKESSRVQFVLNDKNEHTAHLNVKAKQISLVTNDKNQELSIFNYFIAGLFIFVMGGILKAKKEAIFHELEHGQKG